MPTQKSKIVEEQRQSNIPKTTFSLHHLVCYVVWGWLFTDEHRLLQVLRGNLQICYAGLLNVAILLLYYVCSDILRGQTTAQVIIPLLALACYCGTGFCAGLQPIDNSQSPQRIYSTCAEVHVPNTACNPYLCEVYQGFPTTEKQRKLQQLHQARLGWQHPSEALQWWVL